jgi:hypothetical protein
MNVSVGTMGGIPEPITVDDGATVAQALEAAGITITQQTVMRVSDSATVTGEDVVQPGDTLIVVGKVRGG